MNATKCEVSFGEHINTSSSKTPKRDAIIMAVGLPNLNALYGCTYRFHPGCFVVELTESQLRVGGVATYRKVQKLHAERCQRCEHYKDRTRSLIMDGGYVYEVGTFIDTLEPQNGQ
jgi:hypothetical protein